MGVGNTKNKTEWGGVLDSGLDSALFWHLCNFSDLFLNYKIILLLAVIKGHTAG
jgi:hypothetical protein